MYKQLYGQNAVVHVPSSRVIYLDLQPTIHTDAYFAWLAEGNQPEAADIPVAQVFPQPDRKAEIQAELAALDLKLIRPLSEGEADRVAEIVAQKAALREELKGL